MQILVTDFREEIIGKGGIEIVPLSIDALAHGTDEGFLGPAADPALGIGRDVGRIDDTEGSRQGQSAGIRFPARPRMADPTIAESGQDLTLLDQIGVERSRVGAGHRLDFRIAHRPDDGTPADDDRKDEDEEQQSSDGHVGSGQVEKKTRRESDAWREL